VVLETLNFRQDNAPDRPRVFTLRHPERNEVPVVVEIPHAGLELPPQFLPPLRAPLHAIGRDADLFVDRLYTDAPLEGATLLIAHTSRYVVDLNRGEGDVDADAVEGATSARRASRGVVWRLTGDGEPVLTRRLTRAELEVRLDEIHRPYHRALRGALERKIERFGYAILLAAHSMPSASREGGQDARADVVPGTCGRTSAGARFIDAVEDHARAAGFTVRHDEPYKGGFTTQHYGRPGQAVHAVQVELARRLYMDEATLTARPDAFEALRRWCRTLVAKLGKTALP
jgi:N-formylglutamate deformylase